MALIEILGKIFQPNAEKTLANTVLRYKSPRINNLNSITNKSQS